MVRAHLLLHFSIAFILLICTGLPAAHARTLLVSDPDVLRAWEAQDLSFDKIAGNPAAMTRVYEKIRLEIALIQKSDPQAGVGIARYNHRVFDVRWLSSSTHRFELIGVVNRADRHVFYAPQDACGETRLIYRLRYPQSRLPMTLSVEFKTDGAPNTAACESVWQQWDQPLAKLTSAQGPLHSTRLTKARISQLAVNLQSVRWPSAVRPDLGGHAEYLLMGFTWNPANQNYEPKKLENTPDLARLKQDPNLKQRLLSWLTQSAQIESLDQGRLQIPPEYLSETAVSVAPAGMARLANRPFTQLFAKDLKAIDQTLVPNSERLTVRSAQAMLRRLDDMSCMGCHQSRAVAGFHFLGEDGKSSALGNALALPTSPHLQNELQRRRTPTAPRPFADQGHTNGGFGQSCGLGDPGFSQWAYAQGYQCIRHGASGDNTVGVCMPTAPEIGALCEPTQISQTANPHQDRAKVQPHPNASPLCPANSVCERTAVGFPGGMCASACDPTQKNARCGAIAVLTPFNACLAAKHPFARCLRENTRPASLRSCNLKSPCREDYVCAPSQPGSNEGVCMPPYFLFQLRVDGHP
jgi:hypothetical protein